MPQDDSNAFDTPEDYTAFETWRNTGNEPEAEEEETPAAGDGQNAPPASESGTPSGDEGEEEGDKPGEKGKGIQKRIDDLTKARREAERRAEEAERKLAETQGSRPAKENAPAAPEAAADGKPKLDDYETIEAYHEALTDWKLDQREKARESETREQAAKSAWTEKETTFKEAHADYDEVLEKIAIPGNAPGLPALQAAVGKGGPELLYHLGQNPDEATRIAGLKPVDAMFELAKIVAGFKKPTTPAAPEKPQPKLSSAPKPPARVGGAAPSAKAIDDPDLPYAEFEKKREAQLARRR